MKFEYVSLTPLHPTKKQILEDFFNLNFAAITAQLRNKKIEKIVLTDIPIVEGSTIPPNEVTIVFSRTDVHMLDNTTSIRVHDGYGYARTILINSKSLGKKQVIFTNYTDLVGHGGHYTLSGFGWALSKLRNEDSDEDCSTSCLAVMLSGAFHITAFKSSPAIQSALKLSLGNHHAQFETLLKNIDTYEKSIDNYRKQMYDIAAALAKRHNAIPQFIPEGVKVEMTTTSSPTGYTDSFIITTRPIIMRINNALLPVGRARFTLTAGNHGVEAIDLPGFTFPYGRQGRTGMCWGGFGPDISIAQQEANIVRLVTVMEEWAQSYYPEGPLNHIDTGAMGAGIIASHTEFLTYTNHTEGEEFSWEESTNAAKVEETPELQTEAPLPEPL